MHDTARTKSDHLVIGLDIAEPDLINFNHIVRNYMQFQIQETRVLPDG
jgi:hypothetical protein